MNARTLFKKLKNKPYKKLTLTISDTFLEPTPQLKIPADWEVKYENNHSYDFNYKNGKQINVWYCTSNYLSSDALVYRKEGNNYELFLLLNPTDLDISWLTQQASYFFEMLDYIQRNFWENAIFHDHSSTIISKSVHLCVKNKHLKITFVPYGGRQEQLKLASLVKKVMRTLKTQGINCHAY